MVSVNNEKWREFIEHYKNLPELWNTTNENYKNKNMRNKAWNVLLSKYREIEKGANIDSLKKKINNLRTCYRRELKKVWRSEKSARVDEDGVYVPSLWYFDLFEFLKDHQTSLRETLIIDSNSTEEDDNYSIESEQKNKRYGPNDFVRNRVLRRTVNYLSNPLYHVERDDTLIYAEAWACSYRKLSEEQKLFAKKAIDEILVLGQLNKLSLHNITSTLSPLSLCSPPPQTLKTMSTPLLSSTNSIQPMPVTTVLNYSTPTIENESDYSNSQEFLSDN